MLVLLHALAACGLVSAAVFAWLCRRTEQARCAALHQYFACEHLLSSTQEELDGVRMLLDIHRKETASLSGALATAQEAGLAAIAVQERTAAVYADLEKQWLTHVAEDAAAAEAARLAAARAREAERDRAETEALAAAARESAAEAAVRQACGDVGLNRAAFCRGYDLSSTGKIYDVLHHASRALGIDHGVRSVGDVIALLVRSMT